MSAASNPSGSNSPGVDARTSAGEALEALSMLKWRVVRDGRIDGTRNMAMDHALASTLAPGEGVLRLYGWRRPTVSFGRNEPSLGRYDRDRARTEGVDFVRRPTGGRAVLHAGELTYAVVVPDRALGGARATYRRVNEALASALDELGAEARVVDVAGGGTLPLDAGPCFQAPGEGEVVLGGRKIVGSAQARIDGALLQHGSIILSGDQSLLDDLQMDDGAGDIAQGRPSYPQPAALYDRIGRVGDQIVRDAVVRSLEKIVGGTWSEGEYSDREERFCEDLLGSRYGNEQWTWRR